jgi:hypothetical protein
MGSMKQIKWKKVSSEGCSWYEPNTKPIIQYCIDVDEFGNAVLWIYDDHGLDVKLGTFKNLGAAQRKAQSHFERIIGKWYE